MKYKPLNAVWIFLLKLFFLQSPLCSFITFTLMAMNRFVSLILEENVIGTEIYYMVSAGVWLYIYYILVIFMAPILFCSRLLLLQKMWYLQLQGTECPRCLCFGLYSNVSVRLLYVNMSYSGSSCESGVYMRWGHDWNQLFLWLFHST